MWRTTLRSIGGHRRRLVATGSAVVLGVAFLSGSLVLISTVTRGFSDLLAEANAGTDALVRSSREFGLEEVTERGLIDGRLVDTVMRIEGVAAAAPRVENDARIIGADGDPIGGGGRTIAGSWVTDDRLNPYDLAEGRAPSGPGEIVIDRRAAEDGGLAVGDTTELRTPDRLEVTIVGLVTFGRADSQGAATYAGLTTEFATAVLLPEPGKLSSIAVAADPGVSQADLVGRLEDVLPEGVEALTGSQLTNELEAEIAGDDSETFHQALIAFAVIALVVATFTIYNTFSILVAQRTRESALLRALGASRWQLLRSVAAEALVVGLLASVAGIAVGLGLASGLLAVMEARSVAVPSAFARLEPGPVVIALVAGLVVTLAASLIPAARASRIAPLAVLRDVAIDRSATSRGRAAAGSTVTGLGVAVATIGGTGETLVPAGLGALTTLIGVVIVGPVVARHAAALLAPFVAGRGVSGTLARRNARRSPRRTAATATPLLIGVAVVCLFLVVGASLKESVSDAVEEQLTSDLLILGEGNGGLSTDLAAALAEIPQVAAASPTGGGPARIDGADMLVSTIDPTTFPLVQDLGLREGSLRELRTDQVALSADYADEHGLALGDAVTVDYPDGVTERPTVGAIYAGDKLSEGGGGVRLHRDAYLPHTSRPADVTILIALVDGVSDAEGEAAVQRVADRFGAPDVQTSQELTASIAAEIDAILAVVYLLLLLAIVIALMGITNTLSLSIHERTRELGLLRAVGQTQAQTRTMVRGEAVIVSLFGTIGGAALGLFFGWALVSALANEGFGSFAVPTTSLAVVLALGALVGVVAAARPARRAARVDLLRAIATE